MASQTSASDDATEGRSSSQPWRAPPEDGSSKPFIPDHELLKPIGRGSYGEVWLGRSTTGSYRAIKVVYRGSFGEDGPYEREFRGIREFEPISRSHPAQLDILHVGRHDDAGYFYYVMELADDASVETGVPASGVLASSSAGEGGNERAGNSSGTTTTRSSVRSIDPDNYAPKTLQSELKRRGRLPSLECLRIGVSLAEALEHLHGNGLVHRDIKPSNVIFVEGRPKLADIGLVAHADEQLSIVGTEGFLPPEGPGRPSADLYSLGKVFYEMATGNDRREFPQLPEPFVDSREQKAFVEFNGIILKCCERSAENRYQTAAELSADLKAALAGKSVRRRRALRGILAAAPRGAAVLALLALLGFFAIRAFRPARLEKPTPVRIATTIPITFNLSDLGPNFNRRNHDISPDGKRIVYSRDGGLFLHENDFVRPLFEAQSEEWYYHKLPTWAPDGHTIAVVACRQSDRRPGTTYLSNLQNTLLVGDVESGQLRPVPGPYSFVRALLWRPDGSGLTILLRNSGQWLDIDLDGTSRIWPGLEGLNGLSAVADYSPDGRWLCAHDRMDLWLIKAGGGRFSRLTSNAFAEALPAWGDNHTIYYVQSENQQPEDTKCRLMRLRIDPDLGLPASDPEPVLLSTDWAEILHPEVADGGRRLMFIESTRVEWMEVASYPDGNDARIIGQGDSPQLSPDGSEVYYINRRRGDEGIDVLPTEGGKESRRIVSATGMVDGGFDLSPDGSMLAYAYLDDEMRVLVKLVTARGGEPRTLYEASIEAPNPLFLMPRWSPLGDLLSVASSEKQLLLIEATSGRPPREIDLPGINTFPPQWSPSGEHIAFILCDHVEGGSVKYRIEVCTLKDESWKLLFKGYVEAIEWHPDPERQQLTFFDYFPDGYRSAFLNDDRLEVLLPKNDEWLNNTLGTWAPDGKSFYFHSKCDADSVHSIHVYHSSTNQVEHQARPASLPFWSKDGGTFGWINISNQKWDLKAIDLE